MSCAHGHSTTSRFDSPAAEEEEEEEEEGGCRLLERVRVRGRGAAAMCAHTASTVVPAAIGSSPTAVRMSPACPTRPMMMGQRLAGAARLTRLTNISYTRLTISYTRLTKYHIQD
eukprot:SAG25_NODE_198_length_12124_cov_20.420208_16_plen_115_part_00